MEGNIMPNVRQEIYSKLLSALKETPSGPLSEETLQKMGTIAEEDLETLLDNLKYLESKGLIASTSPFVTKDHPAIAIRVYLEDLRAL
jgi:hypothetical protein